MTQLMAAPRPRLVFDQLPTRADLSFAMNGDTMPLDHGYTLFSAISRLTPKIHGNKRVGIHPVWGRREGPGILSLTRSSRLCLRVPPDLLGDYYVLAGQVLDIKGHRVALGCVPQIFTPQPVAALWSRLVVYRVFGRPMAHRTEPHEVLECANRQLERYGVVHGQARLVPSRHPEHVGEAATGVVQVKGWRIIGCPLEIVGLSPEESLIVQALGLGGRRRFGCGVFVPMRPERG